MAGQQGPDRANGSGRGQDGVVGGKNAPSQGDGSLGLPSDQVQAGRAERSRKPKVVREHPVATLVATILVAVIAAAATIVAAVITKTAAPQTTGLLYPGDNSAFCGDVNYPDHTYVTVGKDFVKKWMLCNTGSVHWTGRFLVPSGQDIGNCEFPVRVPVPDTSPGQKAIVAVTVTPSAPGRCYVQWKMVNAADQPCFPDKQGIWFDVVARKAPS
jgi:hypothetical protein